MRIHAFALVAAASVALLAVPSFAKDNDNNKHSLNYNTNNNANVNLNGNWNKNSNRNTNNNNNVNVNSNKAKANANARSRSNSHSNSVSGANANNHNAVSNSASNSVNISNVYKDRLQAPSFGLGDGNSTAPCQGYMNLGGSGPGFGFGFGASRTIKWCKAVYMSDVLRNNYGLKIESLQVLINEDPMVAKVLKGKKLRLSRR